MIKLDCTKIEATYILGGASFIRFHIYKFVHDFHQFQHPNPLQPPSIHLAHPSEASLRLKPQRPNWQMLINSDKLHVKDDKII